MSVISIDNEKTMQNQAKASLKNWVEEGRLTVIAYDALTVLKSMKSSSVDIIASAYTVHNFHCDYRINVLVEIYEF